MQVNVSDGPRPAATVQHRHHVKADHSLDYHSVHSFHDDLAALADRLPRLHFTHCKLSTTSLRLSPSDILLVLPCKLTCPYIFPLSSAFNNRITRYHAPHELALTTLLLARLC